METDTPQGSRYLQLIWINPAETRFALANEQGQKVYDFDLIAFARALAKNMRPLKQSEQLSVVERSVIFHPRGKNRLISLRLIAQVWVKSCHERS